MTLLYIREQGAQVRRRGERLIVSKQGQTLDAFPLNKVEQLVLMGNVQLTTQATATLLQQGIDVVFLSSHGKFRGRLSNGSSKQVAAQQAQLKFAEDEGRGLTIAKALVDGKIHNQRVVLQRQVRRVQEAGRGIRRSPVDFDRALAGMMSMRQQAQQVANLESLRGYEGKAAHYYFTAVRTFLDPAWGFTRREYYPPPDPFNALLSFVYSLLKKDIEAAVNIVGLNPYLGFFHEVQYGRPSLVLDLMEEWRPLVADALCLELVNRGTLTPRSFVTTNNPRRPIMLSEDGLTQVLHAYGSRLDTRLMHPLAGADGGATTIRRAFELQVRRLGHVLSGKAQSYEAITAR